MSDKMIIIEECYNFNSIDKKFELNSIIERNIYKYNCINKM